MIVAGIALGKSLVGLSILERVYPEETRKLFVDVLEPRDGESAQAWFARAFSWTAAALRQHKPQAVLVEREQGGKVTSSIKGVVLAAASQYGNVNVAYETYESALKAISKVSISRKPKMHLRYKLKLRGRVRVEMLRSSALALGRLVAVKPEKLRQEAFEFDKDARSAREVYV